MLNHDVFIINNLNRVSNIRGREPAMFILGTRRCRARRLLPRLSPPNLLLIMLLHVVATAVLLTGSAEPPPLEERVRRLVESVGPGTKGAGDSLVEAAAMSRARRVLASLPRGELLEVLENLGYGDINLGPYERPIKEDDARAGGEKEGGEEEEEEEEEMTRPFSNNGDGVVRIHERHDGRFRQTEVAHHMTVPAGTPLPGVFIEEDSSVVARHHVRAGTGASAFAGTTSEPVSCACDEFDCTCRKQCFCKTQSEPFPTSQPKACPVCKNCDGTPVPKSDGDDDDMGSGGIPDKPNPPPHEFKCSCAFDGGGGSKMGSKNAMDCDCKVSDCSCVRKCKCRAPGS